MGDYWAWAYSDLIDNTKRGVIAEYLVACAIDAKESIRNSWDRYDLTSPEGIKIEVKASGYIQSWSQKKQSIISFRINKTNGWNRDTNEYDTEKRRQSDVYVFCVHKHSDLETINPLDTRQWDFNIVSTRTLNEKCGDQKTISLTRLKEIGTVVCNYDCLYERIKSVANPVMKQ